jgi:hypothetical protein
MFDPLTLFMVGAGALAVRELSRKDYGVLTAARDERYRNAMASCYDSQMLFQEAKLFAEHGLKAQAAMLKRRAEWRSRSDAVKKAHQEIFEKALTSENIQGILEVAAAFEGWTATKKAAILREHAGKLQEKMLVDSMKVPVKTTEDNKSSNGTVIPQNEQSGKDGVTTNGSVGVQTPHE